MVARSEETPSVLSSGESVKTKLLRIAEKARREPGFTFTSLYHLMNEELLRECFKRLRNDAAAVINVNYYSRSTTIKIPVLGWWFGGGCELATQPFSRLLFH